MKPILRKFSPSLHHSFYVQHVKHKEMINPWHYHPEVEIVYIKRSAGTVAVGDYIGNFNSGAIMLFGSNLPHTTVHSENYLHKNAQAGEAITVHFLRECFGSSFFELPEWANVKRFLDVVAPRGVLLKGEVNSAVMEIMEKLVEQKPSKKLISILEILELVAEGESYDILTRKGYEYNPSSYDNARLKTVYNYTFSHYHKPIQIEELAALTHLTRQSFCRFFKSTCRKTYFQFLMEVRIGQACRYLSESDLSITEISTKCGYNNMAHFIRQFKKVTGAKPLQYKKQMGKVYENV